MTNETNVEKILAALRVIQRVCEESTCDACPLRGSHTDCKLQETPPVDWIVVTEVGNWRAFEI